MMNNDYWPKAVFRPDDCALVFYYDNFDHGMEGLVFPVPDYAPGIHRYLDVSFEAFVDACVGSIP